MATLPSLGVLWAQPGTAWAGAHWRGATHSPTHVRTHARSLGHTHEPIRAVALPPITRLIFILESPFARSFPGALPWHALLTHSYTRWHTLVYASLRTHARTHTRPATRTNHPSYSHTNSSAARSGIHTHVSSHPQTHFMLTSGSHARTYYYICAALCGLLPGEHKRHTSRAAEFSRMHLCEHTPQSAHAFVPFHACYLHPRGCPCPYTRSCSHVQGPTISH